MTAAERLEALAAAEDDSREEIVAFLEDSGPPAAADLPRIAHHLTSPDGDTAYWAATLLGRSGPAAAAFVNDLVAATHQANLAARERAVWTLGQIGPAAGTALPRLEELAGTKAPRLARLAREAISSIGG